MSTNNQIISRIPKIVQAHSNALIHTINISGNVNTSNLNANKITTIDGTVSGNLVVSKNITGSGNVYFAAANSISLGAASKISITGGSNGQVLTTDGANLSWTTLSQSGAPGGSSGQIQYNNNGNLSGIPFMTTNGSQVTISADNLKITGGTNGYVLQTDGTGNLSWTAQTSGGGGGGTTSPGGSNQQIQFNDSGSFNGSSSLSFNKATAVLSINGMGLKGNGSWTMTMPASGGSSGQVLTTDGTDQTYWTTVSGTGSGTSTSWQVYGRTTSASIPLNTGGTTFTAYGRSGSALIAVA